MTSPLPPPDYAALVAAVDWSGGPCQCGPFARRGFAPRCETCCEKHACLCEILAGRSVSGKPTIHVWQEWCECPAVFRLRERLK
jgi:hypothetical protein